MAKYAPTLKNAPEHVTFEATRVSNYRYNISINIDAGYKATTARINITYNNMYGEFAQSNIDYDSVRNRYAETALSYDDDDQNNGITINTDLGIEPTGEPEPDITVNVPNTQPIQWREVGIQTEFTLRVLDGFVFKDDCTIQYTSSQTQQETTGKLTLNGASVLASGRFYVDMTKPIIITGETQDENILNITNNVPNTTATGEKTSSYGASVKLTANEGYKITSAKITYQTSYGYPSVKDMAISEEGKTATWENDDFEPEKGVTINGETASEGAPELNVTNNITGEGVTEQHSYDGETATFTVTGEYSYNKVRFFDLKASYTNTAGTPTETPFVVQDLENKQQGTLTVTDIDPAHPVTLSGSYDNVIEVSGSFSNCTANKTFPLYMKEGETLSVTLTANEGTEFDTERSEPQFFYLGEYGDPTIKKLTVSQDKKTASGELLLGDFTQVSVTGSAYPVAVVGQQYGAINVYLVTLDELAQFSAKRFFKETGSDPSTGATTYENIDLGAYVNNIRRIYTNIGASSTDVIRCGNYNTGVSCHQPSEDKITLNFGTAVVPAHNEDNTDFESELQVFLPFAGFVNLNRDYAGQTIALQYVINVVTGNGVALLSCNGVVFQVEEIEPSSEIIYLSPSTQVKTVGGDDWNEMLYYGLEPYIYCKWFESASEGRNTDRQTGIVGDFRGFNVFDDVSPIHTPEMLTEEQESIYTALSDGVYIE